MIRLFKIGFLFVAVMLHISSCKKNNSKPTALFNIPEGFPEIDFPEDNTPTEARINLGKKLFFDKKLSINGEISCATCHNHQLAFTDGKQFSQGVFNRTTASNASTLVNVAYHPYFLKEGGVPTLEQQVLVPIEEHSEFNHNINAIAETLSKEEDYNVLSKEAYNRNLDPYVITRAIAAYERIFLSGNSAYDKYFFQNQSNALSESEKRGLALFNSERLKCNQCHNGFNFTDYSFKNNGLYEEYLAFGRFRITSDSAEIALFKTPTLRNIDQTAPYMHDGSFQSLEEVINHYASGGKNHPNKSALIAGFEINHSEKEDLINFLKSLSDFEFLANQKFMKE